ncbi:hypothetical protein GR702_11735 [Novosphingobium sp. FGD1]|jgi:hypothetical protein|uniref:Uncharacterized protein n=1 Tax=Novosphingobium silvae TaxID=2692619 RepID=A0A7X4GHI0_9SPHN|nr:hypothetical protein [Novosphingobium silvae]MYL98435.1 hypothetical protein [Novosphingobium silvae]
MSATLFALALFACSDDGKACERLATPVQTYETKSLCNARLDDALNTDAARRAEAPTVYAQCLSNRQMASIGTGVIDLTRVNGARFADAAY